jgi:hypothetical protein
VTVWPNPCLHAVAAAFGLLSSSSPHLPVRPGRPGAMLGSDRTISWALFIRSTEIQRGNCG